MMLYAGWVSVFLNEGWFYLFVLNFYFFHIAPRSVIAGLSGRYIFIFEGALLPVLHCGS